MGGPLLFLLLLQSFPATAEARFQLGLSYRAARDHAAAQRSFSEAWDMGYHEPYALYSLIEEDQSLGDKTAGLRHFQLFLHEFPDSPWLHVLYGNAHFLKDRDDEALKEYEEALRLNARLSGVNFRLGYIAFRKGEAARAETYFRRELELNDKYSDASLFLGETLRQLGRDGEALPYYRRAIALDERSELAYRALVAALTAKGDLTGAAEVLARAEQEFPADPSFPAQLARVLTKLHREDEALRVQARFKTLMKAQRGRENTVGNAR